MTRETLRNSPLELQERADKFGIAAKVLGGIEKSKGRDLYKDRLEQASATGNYGEVLLTVANKRKSVVDNIRRRSLVINLRKRQGIIEQELPLHAQLAGLAGQGFISQEELERVDSNLGKTEQAARAPKVKVANVSATLGVIREAHEEIVVSPPPREIQLLTVEHQFEEIKRIIGSVKFTPTQERIIAVLLNSLKDGIGRTSLGRIIYPDEADGKNVARISVRLNGIKERISHTGLELLSQRARAKSGPVVYKLRLKRESAQKIGGWESREPLPVPWRTKSTPGLSEQADSTEPADNKPPKGIDNTSTFLKNISIEDERERQILDTVLNSLDPVSKEELAKLIFNSRGKVDRSRIAVVDMKIANLNTLLAKYGMRIVRVATDDGKNTKKVTLTMEDAQSVVEKPNFKTTPVVTPAVVPERPASTLSTPPIQPQEDLRDVGDRNGRDPHPLDEKALEIKLEAVGDDMAAIVLPRLVASMAKRDNLSNVSREASGIINLFSLSRGDIQRVMVSVSGWSLEQVLVNAFISRIEYYWPRAERNAHMGDGRGRDLQQHIATLMQRRIKKESIILEVCNHLRVPMPSKYRIAVEDKRISLSEGSPLRQDQSSHAGASLR